MKILITGGAGYVGSHMVKTALDAGHDVVVLDDLSTGHADAVHSRARVVRGDVAGAEARALFKGERFDAVCHFAAKIRVDESVSDPRAYFQGNLVKTLALLEAIFDSGQPCPAFVLSSTAAVYGNPEATPIDEDHPKRPESPYGESKLCIERALEAYGRAYGLRWAALRYFNAAGAEPEAGLGERHDPETHLIPIILDVAAGDRAHIKVFGADWPTPDGTCVRDYVHVSDLAVAHLRAVEHLASGGASGAFNLGTGQGSSVREVIRAVERVTGRPIAVVEAPRRPGDPAVLVAKVERAAKVLQWQAKRSDLDTIVQNAWAWKTRAKQG